MTRWLKLLLSGVFKSSAVSALWPFGFLIFCLLTAFERHHVECRGWHRWHGGQEKIDFGTPPFLLGSCMFRWLYYITSVQTNRVTLPCPPHRAQETNSSLGKLTLLKKRPWTPSLDVERQFNLILSFLADDSHTTHCR
ncbi:hypothetical protein BDM02DRAFT_1743995 [Thelephora ganbajun]|uniref:Uncharacterized protein n=1 Tax=Thelephora ganbajun TaxID=370292 RepID=A0ACB6Z0Q2_THEGA|nr:hypothetical protein BDM02DRAFT_1743995 [Thelephora ganbajun]